MAITTVTNPDHLEQLARSQHVLEFLQGEQQRLQFEMMALAQLALREEAKLRSFLGIQGEFTLDAKNGTITTPDPAPTPDAPPVPVEESSDADRPE